MRRDQINTAHAGFIDIYNIGAETVTTNNPLCITATSTPLFVPRSSTAIAIRGHSMEAVTTPSTARLEKGKGEGGRLTDWLKVTLEAYGLFGIKSVSARKDPKSSLYDNGWQC